MMTSFERIFAGATTGDSYLLIAAMLGALAAVSLLQARRSILPDRAFGPMFAALAVLVVSRLWVARANASDAIDTKSFFAFSTACFGYFYLLASSLLKAPSAQTDGEQKRDAKSVRARETQLVGMAGLFGLIAVVICLIRMSALPQSEFVPMVGGALTLGATIPTIGALLWMLRSRVQTLGVLTVITTALLGASWALFAGALLKLQSTIDLFAWARFVDVMALVAMQATLLGSYIRLGVLYKKRLFTSEGEGQKAKKELDKLNKITTNIYEDSSELIKKQKEQTLQFMHKVDSLEKILQIGITIQKRHRLDDVLQMIVDLVRDNLGFQTVTLRMYNKKAQSFETSAYVGLSDEVKDTVLNYRIPLSEYKKMIEPRFRISKSYFIRNADSWYGQELGSEESMLVEDSWGDIDMLLVPLLDDDLETTGYLSVENPSDPKLSVADVIESLESIASLAVIAIRNARFFKQLEKKNEKLRVYADKLSSLNKLKSNFVATISHEFRTPLTSIKAYCDTLLKNADNVDRDLLKQFLVVIDEESTRLMTLIEDILDFSQMESGAMKFEKTPCNLCEMIENATSDLEKNFRNRSIKLHKELPEQGVFIQGENELMKQLVVNLLHNASKFTKDNGSVWIRVNDDTSSVRITVEDEGIGVPDDQLERIFEQFHQADNSSTRKYGGSGLGLAICKNIVEWHDGRIWVENVKGRGARFVAVLPKKHVFVQSHVVDVYSTVRRFEVERLLELLVESVAEFLQVRKASLMLVDRKGELRIEGAVGIDEEVVENARVKLNEGIAGKVASEGRTMLVANIERDERTSRSNNDPLYGSKSFLSVPIKSEGKVIGVVNVASPHEKATLDQNDARLLEMLATRLSVAIERLRDFAGASVNYEKVRETFKAILEARRYIDLKDENLIESIVSGTAQAVGLTEEEISRLQYVMHVYDLGLAKVGYHIIKKPQQLSPVDRREIEEHTELGTDMLSILETSPEVEAIVRSHHENFDGSGYPGKLKGEEIPVEARIIRLADTLRAMISQRPYQRQYTVSEAVDVIKHRSGTFFDPEIVEVFAEVTRGLIDEGADEVVDETRESDTAPEHT